MIKPHLQAIQLVLTRFQSHLKSTLLVALVIGVAMSLPGLFYLAIDHIGHLTNSLQENNEVTVFLQLDTDEAQVKTIRLLLKEHPQIKTFRFIDKNMAWKSMQAKLKSTENMQDTVQLDNPLPDAFYVKGHSSAPDALEALKKDLTQIPAVDHVLFNNDWSKRIASLVMMAKKVIYFISILLAIGLFVIIGNTIRMQIMTQREEIEVSNLIGATNSFIRLPFLYAGALYGFLGSLFGIVIIVLSMSRFNQAIAELANLYQNRLAFGGMGGEMVLFLILAGITMGWLAAFMVVNHTLKTFVLNQNKR